MGYLTTYPYYSGEYTRKMKKSSQWWYDNDDELEENDFITTKLPNNRNTLIAQRNELQEKLQRAESQSDYDTMCEIEYKIAQIDDEIANAHYD